MICKECQKFLGSHSHNEPYHQPLCKCDGSNQSNKLFQDPEMQVELRMREASDTLKELTGDYSGTEIPTVILHSAAVRKLFK